MTPAIDVARKASIDHEVIEFESAAVRGYGAEAAALLGIEPALIYKTLVVQLDGKQLVLALVAVEHELDLKALATFAGAKRAQLATTQVAERATGYRVGGISPLGQKQRLHTFIDEDVAACARVHVSAGRRGLEIALRPDDLIALTNATLGKIKR